MTADMTGALERFYAQLSRLRDAPGQGRPLRELPRQVPERGVYFFLEPGEWRLASRSVPRVVRVGTHAVSAGSRSTLRGRLKQHLGTRSGGGNHRGSIFRLHVGTALLNRDGSPLASWGRGSTLPSEVRADAVARAWEEAHERRVSAFIGEMPVYWVAISDEPGPLSDRAVIEKNAVALLSNRCVPTDRASNAWLGQHSPRQEIRGSGLWNLNYVNAVCEPQFLEKLRSYIDAQLGPEPGP